MIVSREKPLKSFSTLPPPLTGDGLARHWVQPGFYIESAYQLLPIQPGFSLLIDLRDPMVRYIASKAAPGHALMYHESPGKSSLGFDSVGAGYKQTNMVTFIFMER